MNAVGRIAWREKFVATGIHFLVTLTLAACAAALVFLVWFPDPFQTMIGGTELFMLVVGCDLVLGPLVSLVIYNSRKSRGKLVFDYVVVGFLQITAMIYGVSVLAGSRPVFVAFSIDRFEIVTAREITDQELAAVTRPEYARLSMTGPRLVAIDVPPADRTESLFQAMSGNDVYLRPKFFVPYETKLTEIRERAKPIGSLIGRKPASAPLIEAVIADIKLPAERIHWVPAHNSKRFLTALIDVDSGKPVGYVDLDPY